MERLIDQKIRTNNELFENQRTLFNALNSNDLQLAQASFNQLLIDHDFEDAFSLLQAVIEKGSLSKQGII